MMMASLFLFCSTVLAFSCSITLGTVDIFQSQDRSVCHGMKANLTCVTVIPNGLLRWDINGKTVFNVVSGQTASFSETINGSEFVFVRGSEISGVNIYTSTVSLNTNITNSIRCSDGFLPRTFEVEFIVEEQPSDSSTINNRDDLDSVIISWTPPVDAGICCVQYHVVSSNGTTVNTTATSFTLSGITAHKKRQNAYISVRCMDQIGTMGPEVIYRPVIDFYPVTVSNPELVGFSDNMPIYEVGFNLPNSTIVAVALVKSCAITIHIVSGSGRVVQLNCDLLLSRATFIISDLSPFRVEFTFNYGLGFESSHSSPINGSYYDTSTLIEATLLIQFNHCQQQITGLQISSGVLGALLLIAVTFTIAFILIIIFPSKRKKLNHELTMRLQEI